MISLFSVCKLLLIFLIRLLEWVSRLVKLFVLVFFLLMKYLCAVGVENLLNVDLVKCGNSSLLV